MPRMTVPWLSVNYDFGLSALAVPYPDDRAPDFILLCLVVLIA